MPPLRLGFAGTPGFSVASLEATARWVREQSDARLVGVWTQPDRPAGRGRHVTMSPVKRVALEHQIPVHQPRTLRSDEAIAELVAANLDLLIVVAYGLILPAAVLEAPRLGCINVHASLLPRWRGAAPIQRAILAGDRVSGVGIMQITAGLDTGPVWREAKIRIDADDTGATLHDKLALLGASELVAALGDVFAGRGEPRPQDDTFATYAGKLTKAEARIDWSASATAIHNRIRAFNSWPVADTLYEGRQLRIWEARLVDAHVDSNAPAPGTVQGSDAGLRVVCGDGQLLLTRVQLAGGKAMNAGDFANAHPCVGIVLGRD